MAELVSMWRNTRMVVLTAICAALYAAILIPFKVLPIIPGVTELRPVNAVPVVCSFLFGPAAAWGAAFGNLIADFFGGLGPGDLFGFAGNLLYGHVPYASWRAITTASPVPRDPSRWRRGDGAVALARLVCMTAVRWLPFAAVVGLACVLCATVVGWGLQVLGFHPFTVLGTIVLVNNVVSSFVLAPPLLRLLHPRVARAGLLYRDLLDPRPVPPAWCRALGLGLLAVGTLGGFAAGQLIASHRWTAPWANVTTASGAFEVGFGVLPFLVLAVLGLACL